jgi:hypothetical protein
MATAKDAATSSARLKPSHWGNLDDLAERRSKHPVTSAKSAFHFRGRVSALFVDPEGEASFTDE